jgi:hypothetical protein
MLFEENIEVHKAFLNMLSLRVCLMHTVSRPTSKISIVLSDLVLIAAKVLEVISNPKDLP